MIVRDNAQHCLYTAICLYSEQRHVFRCGTLAFPSRRFPREKPQPAKTDDHEIIHFLNRSD